MIKLDIQPYCEDCTVFDPDVERPQKAYTTEGVILSDTVVRCCRRKTCERIKRYLEKEITKDDT